MKPYHHKQEHRHAIPTATDELHNIPITATDKAGNPAPTTLNFTANNTHPPTLNPTLNQTLVKSGDKITITTTSDPDTQSVKAYIQDNTYQLTKKPRQHLEHGIHHTLGG